MVLGGDCGGGSFRTFYLKVGWGKGCGVRQLGWQQVAVVVGFRSRGGREDMRRFSVVWQGRKFFRQFSVIVLGGIIWCIGRWRLQVGRIGKDKIEVSGMFVLGWEVGRFCMFFLEGGVFRYRCWFLSIICQICKEVRVQGWVIIVF